MHLVIVESDHCVTFETLMFSQRGNSCVIATYLNRILRWSILRGTVIQQWKQEIPPWADQIKTAVVLNLDVNGSRQNTKWRRPRSFPSSLMEGPSILDKVKSLATMFSQNWLTKREMTVDFILLSTSFAVSMKSVFYASSLFSQGMSWLLSHKKLPWKKFWILNISVDCWIDFYWIMTQVFASPKASGDELKLG